MPYVPIKLPAGFYKNGTEYEASDRWHDGSLVRWLDGSLRPVEGWTERKANFSNDPIRGMHTWQSNSGNAWIAAGSANELIVMTGGGTIYYITPDDLAAGVVNSAVSTGYGFGPYGTGYWGQPRPVTSDQVPVESTTWQLDNFGEELVGVHINDGRIWNWDLTTTVGSELVFNGDFEPVGNVQINWNRDMAYGSTPKWWTIANGVASFKRFGCAIDTNKEGTSNLDDIDIAANKFRTSPNHFNDGDTVKYTNGGGTDIGGLTNNTDYFIVNVSTPNYIDFQVAATSGGTPITLSHVNQITVDGDAVSTTNGIDYSANRIYQAHTYTNGQEILYNNGGGSSITGLQNDSTYFVVNAEAANLPSTQTSFQLANTANGTPIDISKETYTINPVDAAYKGSNTLTVTVTYVGSQAVFAINGAIQPELELLKGNQYYFDNFHFSNGAHPIIFKHNGVQYTDGISQVGTPGYGTAFLSVQLPANAPENLTYSCSVHGDAMGGNITTLTNSADPNYPVVDYSSNIIELFDNHNLQIDDAVKYVVPTGSEPIGGLVDGTTYYIRNIYSNANFKLSTSIGGSVVPLIAPPELVVDATDSAKVDITNNKITMANTFTNGMKVYYNKGNGQVIGGLTHNADYYIVNATANEFQVSATSGGTPIDFTALGLGTVHLFRKRLGSAQFLVQVGASQTFRQALGENHRFDIIDNGTSMYQNVSGLVTLPDIQDSHDVTCTVIDPQDDPPWNASANISGKIKLTGTTTGTVVVEQDLALGVNTFRFGADDTQVKLEVIPNAGSRHFDVDNISLKQKTVAEPVANAPINNKGVFVTEERFIFALGAGGNPKKVQWCDKEQKSIWTPLATNEAGDFELATSGQIMCGINTRGVSLIITDTDAFQANYQGPPYVYGFQKVGTNCGAISRLGTVSTDVGAFWFGTENFHYFDGNSVQTLKCDVHDYVFNDFNSSQQSKIWGMVNGAHSEIWWFYCSGESIEIDRYVAYDYKDNHWLIGNLARTSGVSRGVFTYPFMASHNTTSTIYNHEVGYNYEGANIFCETGPISIGTGDQVAKVTEVVVDEETQGDVDLKFKAKFLPNDVEREYGPFNPANPTAVRFTGRQIKMRVEGDQKTNWKVGTMRLDIRAGGRR